MNKAPDGAAEQIERLFAIMAKLRNPDGGCPWDLEQTFETIAPYTLEEAYEVVDAIAAGDMDSLCDELGDLLLQVIFHARMAEERDFFDFTDVARAIAEKMIRRHPHVFADATAEDTQAVLRTWEEIKSQERAAKDESGSEKGLLDGIVRAAPALIRARKLQEAAASVGFDWLEVEGVFSKLNEEIEEVRAARKEEDGRVAEEIGDLLFTAVSLARRLEVDPETALRAAGERFHERFNRMEEALKRGGERFEETTLERMDELWEQAKADETA